MVASRYYHQVGEVLERQWHLGDLFAAWLTQFYKPALPTAVLRPEDVLQPLVVGRDVVLQLAAFSKPAATVYNTVYNLARGLINAGIFIVLFALVERLWFFVGAQVTFFRKWIVFRPFDRLGGGFLGALWGFIGGAVLVLLLHRAADLGVFLAGPDNFLTRAVSGSALVPYYDGLLRVASGVFSFEGVERVQAPLFGKPGKL